MPVVYDLTARALCIVFSCLFGNIIVKDLWQYICMFLQGNMLPPHVHNMLSTLCILLLTIKLVPADSCHELLCTTSTGHQAFLKTSPCCQATSSRCADIKAMSIEYKSCDHKTAEVNSTLTSPYPQLTCLEILGNFSIITSDALAHLHLLETFIITKTNITELPSGLFDNKTCLITVKLTGNGFKNIPDAIFQLGSSLDLFEFSYNWEEVGMPLSNGTSVALPSGFQQLHNLEELNLTGLILKDREKVGPDFFSSVNQTIYLDLSEADVFYGDQTLLRPLENLAQLSINHVEPYLHCPSAARSLFSHLPKTLIDLYMMRWANAKPVNDSCVLNKEVMEKLRAPPIEYLSFKYSDYIFGYKLEKALFSNMTELTFLDIGFCRFSKVEKGALHNLPKLWTLVSSGNPLGPREFQFFSDGETSGLRNLELRDSTLWSDRSKTYNMTWVLGSTPDIRSLDISNSRLRKLPVFGLRNDGKSYKSFQFLKADDNELRTVSWHWNGSSDTDPCPMFPGIRNISMARNKIEMICHLCLNLTSLNLADNRLATYFEKNMKCLKRQRKLQDLDLSRNDLRSVDEDLLSLMVDLTNVSLSHNQLAEVPVNVFAKNKILERIDLSWNNINAINEETFSHLRSLKMLDLSVNSFSTIPEPFLKFFDRLPTNSCLELDQNSFDCRCSRQYFQDWLNKNKNRVPEFENLRCSTPSSLVDKHVYNYTTDQVLCDMEKFGWPIIGSLASLVAVVLVVMPCYRYWWYVKHTGVVARAILEQLRAAKKEYKCEYDAYVSFDYASEEDSRWVIDKLIPALEETTPGSDGQV